MTDLSKFAAAMKVKKVVLCSDNTTDKSSWKRYFVEAGVPVAQVITTSSFQEASEALNKNPDIFMTGQYVNNQSCLELVDRHIEKQPDRSRAWTFVCTENNSLLLSSYLAEKNVDGIILKPYNSQDISDSLGPSLIAKLEMKKETKLYHEILALVKTDQLDEASEKLEIFKKGKEQNPYPYYLEGLIKEGRNNIDEAIDLYFKSLEFDEKNYLVLSRLFDLLMANRDYEQAYSCAEVLCENHPINPNRIPEMIRASIATKNFENLIKFCDAILNSTGNIAGLEKPLAAALIVAAKSLAMVPKARDLVIDALRRGVSLIDRNSPIFISALETFLLVDDLAATKKLLDEIPSDEMDEDLLAIDLEYTYKSKTPVAAFEKAQGLVKNDKANEKSYLILLKAAKELGKDSNKLEDMAFDAARIFPELKNEFLNAIK